MNKKQLTFGLLIIALLFLYIGKEAKGQTMPEVDDPRIEARFVARSDSDKTSVLGQDVIGERAVNILVVGDGFTEGTKEKFFSFCSEQGAFFMKNVPKLEKFNLIAIWLPSVDDGIDIPEEGIVKDTPLDSRKRGTTLDVKENPVPFLEQILQRKKEGKDFIAVVCNTLNGNILSSTNITTEGQVEIVSLTLEREGGLPYEMTHELGHLIADLADEYLAVGTGKKKQEEVLTYYGGKVSRPNLIGNVNWPKDADGFPIIPRSDIPWADMIPEGVPIPTSKLEVNYFGEISYDPLPGYENVVGCFGPERILFAPVYGISCLMTSPGQVDNPATFCPVCKRQWEKVVLGVLRPKIKTQITAVNIREEDQPFADTLKHEFQWKTDGEVFQAEGLLLTSNTAFLFITIPELTGEVENKKEYWTAVSDAVSEAKNPILATYLVGEGLPGTQEFGFVVGFSTSGLTIPEYSAFHVEANIPEFGRFTIKPNLSGFNPPTPTPVLPTPTPTSTPTPTVTATPVPVVVSEVKASVTEGGMFSVLWKATANPSSFLVHIYKNGVYFTQKSVEGKKRTAEFPEFASLRNARLLAYVAAEGGSFTPSNEIVFNPLEPTATPTLTPTPIEPTPTEVPLNTITWEKMNMVGGGIGGDFPKGSVTILDGMEARAAAGEVVTMISAVPVSGNEITASVSFLSSGGKGTVNLAVIDADLSGTLNLTTLKLNEHSAEWREMKASLKVKAGAYVLIQASADTGESSPLVVQFQPIGLEVK